MESEIVTMVEGTTEPPLEATLRDSEKDPIPLDAAANVYFYMQKRNNPQAPQLGGQCDIVDATASKVNYQWQTLDTIERGDYNAHYKIVWQDGGIQFVPNGRYNTIRILKDLDPLTG